MTHITPVASALAAAIALAAGPLLALAADRKAPREPEGAAQAAWVAEANNAFAADLHGKLAGQEGNLFYSPSSIETALAMTAAGARGRTAEQMIGVCMAQLHPDGEATLNKRFKTLAYQAIVD